MKRNDTKKKRPSASWSPRFVRQPGPDRELDALRAIVAALLGLPANEQRRALVYINSRFPEVADGYVSSQR